MFSHYIENMKSATLIIATIFVTVMFFLMRWQGQTLQTSAITKGGILALEFAKTTTRANECLAEWRMQDMKNNTYLDFIFITSYTFFFVTAIRKLTYRKLISYGLRPFMIAVAIIAGLTDFLENMQILRYVSGAATDHVISSVYWLASFKFVLVGLTIVFLLISLLYTAVKKTGKQSE